MYMQLYVSHVCAYTHLHLYVYVYGYVYVYTSVSVYAVQGLYYRVYDFRDLGLDSHIGPCPQAVDDHDEWLEMVKLGWDGPSFPFWQQISAAGRIKLTEIALRVVPAEPLYEYI
jgi:hypothetical protein